MDLASNLPVILPLATEWADERSAEIQTHGSALNNQGIELAKKVGVSYPEKVKVMEVPTLPMPSNPILKEAALSTGLLGPNTIGLTLGHSIYICSGRMTKRLLSHELRHVHQYERHGSISRFLTEYLSQIATHGYNEAPLEIDARAHEIHT
ncbi:MAG: hypothetical protein ABW148_17280 [Sedimenticola sp.]